MMGDTKLSTIRRELREVYARLGGGDPRTWFDREIQELERDPEANTGRIESLQLLRDGLAEPPRDGARPAKSRKPNRQPESGEELAAELQRIIDALEKECKRIRRAPKKKNRTPRSSARK